MDLSVILQNKFLLIAGLTVLSFSMSFFLFYRIGTEVFKIYKRNFIRTVDKGFRDALIYLDPGQVFTLTVVFVVIATPILIYYTSLITTVIGVGVVLIAPKIVLDRIKKKRAEQFVHQLPDALASISASLRAGLNLMKAFNQVVKNQPNPLSAEFAQVMVEYRVGKDLIESLDELHKRVGRDELVLMNCGIKISREIGGNLADTLDTLASTLREKARVEGKIRALTSMGRSQAIVAMGLPVAVGYFMYKIEPDTMIRLFTTTAGMWWLGAMGFLMVVAWVLIRKIINVDI